MTPATGLPPSDWREFRLGDLLKFSNGINADKSAYGSGVPFANVLEVINNDSLQESDIPGRVNLPRKTLARFEVRRGDILFNRTSETQEEVALASVYLGQRPIVFGGFVFRGRPLTDSLDFGFAKYALRSAKVRGQIVARGQGGIRANIGQRDLRTVTIDLPSLPEQRVIIGALDDVSDQIKLLRQIIAKKQAIKQGMMQQYIVGRTSIHGQSKVEWDELHLGQLLRRPPRYGINAAAVPLIPGVSAYIRITDISDSGKFIPDPKVGVSHHRVADYKLEPGEIVIARTGASVGKWYLYDPRDGELVYAGFLINVAPNPKLLNPTYLSLFMQTKAYWNWVARTSARSGQPGINGQEYAQLPIPLPDIATQDAITRIFIDVDRDIEALERRLVKAQDIKTGMMQQLLTGRIHLPVQEAAA
jgi:type I restriction enzyme, S subunit